MPFATPIPPAQPILASTLYNIHTRTFSRPPNKRRKLATGFKALDREVLNGGFEYGEGGIVCFSASEDGGKSTAGGGGANHGSMGEEIAYSTLASHLLSSATPSNPSQPRLPPSTNSSTDPAFYIDTLGTFSPHRLHALLCRRLKQPEFTHQGGYVYKPAQTLREWERREGEKETGRIGEGHAGKEREEVEELAAKMLDRVRIMRAFDFKGVMECIGEVGSELRRLEEEMEAENERHDRRRHDAEVISHRSKRDDQVSRDLQAAPEEDILQNSDILQATQRRNEIPDSQADDVDLSMSFDHDFDHDFEPDDLAMAKPPQSPFIEMRRTSPSAAAIPSNAAPQSQHHLQPGTTPHTLLILPSLPRLLSPLMHSNHIRGHALLVHLLRSLRHLTSSHSICILILNSVVGAPSTYRTADREGKQTGAGVVEGPSIFASNGGLKPALGKTFAWGLDLSLMGSEIAGDDGRGGENVVEVVNDRYGDRVGAWCVLE